MSNKIYLFRHGQSQWNKRHIFTGWANPDLTELGVKQAVEIGIKLKEIPIDLAYTNEHIRCRRTLALALQYHVEVPVHIDQRLNERDYGDLSGTSKDDYEFKHGKKALQKIRRSYDYPPPKGESLKMVEQRVNPFIEELLETIKKDQVNVLICASGNSMRPFRKRFENLTNDQMATLENPLDDYFEYQIEA